MKKVIGMAITALILLSLPGCSKEEPSVVKVYEVTDSELVEEYLEKDELVTFVPYYEMSDGTWKTERHTYLYRLEITGKKHNAAKESTFVFLSNTKDITFEEAWRASGISSYSGSYFPEEDAIFVAWK
ncbi:MAG: immunogenic protein [Lachnospiraceae bacterium]|nr:immunogenic protein [Lachnospiraceae bacterium]